MLIGKNKKIKNPKTINFGFRIFYFLLVKIFEEQIFGLQNQSGPNRN